METERTILIVGESEDDRYSYKILLRRDESILYDFVEASSGKDSLDLLSSYPVACVLLDDDIADMSVLDLIREIVGAYQSVPIILLTASDNAGLVKDAVEIGASDHLNKETLSSNLLIKAVQYGVDRKKRDAQIFEFNKRIRQELAFAAKLQQIITLPEVTETDRYAMHARYLPCDEMAGDYLNAIEVEDTLYIISADVSGHGVVASFYSFILDSIISGQLVEPLPVDELIETIQDEIEKYLAVSGVFITMQVFCVDLIEWTLTYGNAGHPPFFLYNKERAAMYFKKGLFISGFFPGTYHWKTETIALAPDDRIFLFTDGAYEIFDANDKTIGFEYIEDFATRNCDKTGEEFLDMFIAAITEKNGSAVFEDDVSLCVFEQKR